MMKYETELRAPEKLEVITFSTLALMIFLSKLDLELAGLGTGAEFTPDKSDDFVEETGAVSTPVLG